ncbi:valine--tRNA ligase [Candidatus Azambacteria bacterium RIFCSPHIGHO2_02_FULL_52_12]|uniref:Valine--tRNA ligase n=1 Tax=Candidatus Azambacteria bacterium RIFCSPLOWO2_01_FULL_46_25 TaxID=1797298 RepID=A0A1F5BV85_9BACT|nr:MAG: valine--tRNA ligase [Candidatus Azambacteria bacterium RIFCSPHIGHO2_02_FULL_52_12]OGD34524.1 MAG: valine--tRNA ligase [Candidatus Azambacteria bacterium RIFCSPLOWO2_01_FULL_46_25]OGD36398.1 MAG: valine--tRNA ligase [Candidatus Azambacteria bacterium RIFCSPHIGHO2_01_FULL_51_74]
MSQKISDAFSAPYDPKKVEKTVYRRWEESGFFNPNNLPIADNAKTFTMMLPPPNVTGVLHMGHALNATVQDILIRKKRMEGYRALWVPGTDHAGIATQNVVEKDLKKQGVSRHDLGREKFLEKVWEWKEKYGNIILDQLKTLGASCDWSRTVFTMDDSYKKAVETAFKHYYEKGLIYQGERVINWCTRCATSLSDLELEYKEEKGTLYYIKYPLKDNPATFVVVATTRPETMLGDTAVAVHPDDARYKTLVGKTLMLPIQEKEIPLIADSAVEKEFGTGAVKVTPAHSIADFEIGERHRLPLVKVIDERGKMTQESRICEGLNTQDCRVKVVETLKAAGLLEKEEPLIHNVAHCYRCDKVIEQILSKQWFVKMDGLAKKAADAVRSGAVSFYPKNFEKLYLDWLDNTRDWCISRQIWWGHKIPLEGVDDVLDTWFSSALWPFAALGWPSFAKASEGKPSDLERFYPTQVLSTGRDIINLWVSRMIFSGLEFMREIPFSNVYINPTVLAKDGRRMSKSLGTGIDPLVLVEKYGADATRFGLIWQMMGVQDMHFSEEHLLAGKKFSNKLWNIARFVLQQTENFEIRNSKFEKIQRAKLEKPEREILEKLEQTIQSVHDDIDAFKFGQALHTLYDFVWHDFADVYIEHAKTKDTHNAKRVLSFTLAAVLKLLHPFMPFITEEIWTSMPIAEKKLLMIETWPTASS